MSQKIRLLELFSGLGAQIKAFKRVQEFDVEVVGTCDLDKEVVVGYAATHCGLTHEMIESYKDYPPKDVMAQELTEKRFGYDFEKDKQFNWSKLASKESKTKGIEKYWLADKLSKNLGDIVKVKSLPETDVLFYSSPCTDFSVAGKQEGSNWSCRDCNKEYNPLNYSIEDRYKCPYCDSKNIKSTRSGLLFEIERLLVDYKNRNSLPKFLILENVAALTYDKFRKEFKQYRNKLNDIGYNNYFKVLNSKDYGVPQSRDRVFMVSIRKDIDNKLFEFPKPFKTDIRLKDVLETDVDDKYYLSDDIQLRFKFKDKVLKNIIGDTKPECRTIGTRDEVYGTDGIMGALLATDWKQPKQIYVGDNKPCMVGNIPKIKFENRGRIYADCGTSPTLIIGQGKSHNVNILKPKDDGEVVKLVRKLTPLECFRLQDFDDIDYLNCKNIGMTDGQAYKAMGNSITVKCIELIAQHIYKAQYDKNYIPDDEKILSPSNISVSF